MQPALIVSALSDAQCVVLVCALLDALCVLVVVLVPSLVTAVVRLCRSALVVLSRKE